MSEPFIKILSSDPRIVGSRTGRPKCVSSFHESYAAGHPSRNRLHRSHIKGNIVKTGQNDSAFNRQWYILTKTTN